MKKTAIVLCSGGLDSVTTAYLAKNEGYDSLILLFFNYNQNSLSQEDKSVSFFSKQLGAKLIKINLPDLSSISSSLLTTKLISSKKEFISLTNTKKESEKYYLPARNILFLSYALSFAETLSKKDGSKTDILIGFKHEGKEFYPDTTPKFLESFNLLSKNSTETGPLILAPLIEKDKEDIIQMALELGIPLEKTFSCYSPFNEFHCGSCLACLLRKEGFKWANVEDKTNYSV